MTSPLVCVSSASSVYTATRYEIQPSTGVGGFRQSESAVMVRRRDSYFFVRLLDDVILLVVIRSPMYFCRNLLLLSNLSCSSRTASMRLNMVTRDS